jgi:hypothetical protein
MPATTAFFRFEADLHFANAAVTVGSGVAVRGAPHLRQNESSDAASAPHFVQKAIGECLPLSQFVSKLFRPSL